MFLPALLAGLTACAKDEYADRLSEVRSDIFYAETEQFTVTLFCTAREYPYADDGIACPVSKVAEISVVPVAPPDGTVEVYVVAEGGEWGGEASYRSVYGDYRYSQGVDVFPAGSVTLRVVYGDRVQELAATSVRNEHTLSPEAALNIAAASEAQALARMKRDGVLCAEFRVRLLRRDKNYYYVGVIDGKTTISLLLDADTGEVLARRESPL